MENLNGTHSAGLGSTVRKKRSIISRRPCSDLQKLWTSTLLSSSTQFLNCGHNEEQVASGSDGLRSEKRLKKLKLKFGGVTHTIHAKPATEYAFNGGSSLTKSYQGFDASRSREKLLVQDSSFRKGNSSGRKMSSESIFVNGTSHFEAVRKSNRVPKRCAMDVEFDEDGDIDEEVRYLGRLNAYKERRRGVSMVSDGRQEDKDFVQEEEPTSEDEPGYPSKRLGYVGGRNESTTTAHKRARQTAKDDFLVPGASLLEFPNGLPSIPPKKQKTKLSEVEQQLKKAEAAQRRRMQSEKAAREAEAEAIRKIRGQDSGRKKKEEKMRKQRDEVVQAKAAKADAIGPNTVRWVIGPTGTTVIFSDDIGLPRIFNSLPCSYPPPREKCAGPNCTNAYKYRDSKSKLPLCSLHCYKAIHGKMQPLITC